jgi:CRP-like cAMP-binding protein
MSEASSNAGFTVWADDRTPHGPMDLIKVISWVKSGQIVAGTWIFDSRNATWERAANVPELQMFFQARSHLTPARVEIAGAAEAIDIRTLRRIKLLSYFTDEQLERFTQFVVAEQMPPQAVIVKQGDCGNAMYVVLEGELSVRLNTGGLETELAMLGMGDFFGDFGLFDQGPRSASVVARTSCLLLKISVEAFEKMSHEATDLATPFLRAIAKTLAARIRAGNKHRGEAVKFSHALR